MVNNILKKILAKGFEYSTRKTMLNKFKLYGDYQHAFSWKTYKQIEEHKQLFLPLKYKVNIEWYKYFTLVRQEEDPNYLPEDIWHILLEPALNNRSYAKALNDKNLFHTLEYKHLFPKAFIHLIQGVCYNSDFIQIPFEKAFEFIPNEQAFVVKKSIDSGGGKGVGFYSSKTSASDLISLIEIFGNNFVVQEKVVQHKWFERFNPSSINTIRVVTYRSVIDEKVRVLQTLLRMGKPGSMVDNQSSGGIACGINTEGKLNSWGCDKLSNKFSQISNINFSDLEEIPDFEQLKAVCISIASKRFHERILVFDTWRDVDNNIRLLEINNINIGIEDLQKNNGAMFGKYTKDIINYCSSNPKSYCFDYEL